MTCNLRGILIRKSWLSFLHSFMLRCLFFCIFSSVSIILFAGSGPAAIDFKRNSSLNSAFLENEGQMIDMDGNPVPFVLFKHESRALNMYITEKGLTYLFLKCEEKEGRKKKDPFVKGYEKEKEEEIMKWERVDMALENASIKRENIITEGRSQDFSQYFLGHCPDGITDVHSYDKVTIKNVYPGIDWVFYNSTEKGVKYDFIVHPGADPTRIRLIYSSKEKLKLSEQGAIQIKTSYGDLTENAPESFLEEKLIESKFKIISQSKNDFGGYETKINFDFGLGALNFGLGTLTIDPQLVWATFFGGSAYDGPWSVTPDKNTGDVYVTGYSQSANFPTLSGGGYFQGSSAGGVEDCFILKFNNAGVRLWSTYYGGSGAGEDRAHACAVDNAGNLFITGTTCSANFPLQNPGGTAYYQSVYGGVADFFVLKFNSAGTRLWATLYGGPQQEEGLGITVDPSGNIFVTGETWSRTGFPSLNPGGTAFFQATLSCTQFDAFVVKFDNSGTRLWATIMGGYNNAQGNAIDADAAGNIFVTGWVAGGAFPVLNAGGTTFYQGAVTGSTDAFIMKFSNTGTLLWSTYYGGGAVDEGNSIVADASGNVFVTGSTAATNLPTLNPGGGAYFQGTKSGTWDTYMLKFDNSGTRLWATYFGGSGDETTKEYTNDNLDIDQCGNVYMSVETTSSNTPTQPSCDGGYFDNSFNGGVYDLFITQFSNTGALLWATYLGGDGDDFRSPIGIDNNNNLFMSGEWTDGSPITSATYPVTDPGAGAYYEPQHNGGHDGFMTKFVKTVPTMSVTAVNSSCGCTGTATANPAGICSPFTYSWSNGQTTQTATGLCAGTYSVFVGNSLCGTVTGSVTITSAGGFSVTPTSTPSACLLTNGSATVTPSAGTGPYTYAWSPSVASTSAASGLAAGNYSVTVTDANGCSSSTVFSITSAGGPTLTLSGSTDVLCNGDLTGTAEMTASGGTPAYTYAWSPSGGSSSAATGLGAGDYTLTVTDVNGCLITETVTITEPPALTTTLSSTPASCGNSSGTASASASGGTSPYTFVWSNGVSTAQISNLISQDYTATITDANGCTVNSFVTVASIGSVTATATNATICAGQTASLDASGGNTYVWSNGQSTSSINISPSTTTTYTVVVAVGTCTASAVGIVTISPQPVANAGNDQTVCIGSPVTMTATGGGTYLWSTGQTSASLTTAATSNSTYSVLVTSAGGCTATASVNVITTPSIVANAGPDQTVCVGSSASLTASGGTGYSWSPSAGLNDPNIYNPIATPSATTTYTVVVTSGSCTPATAVVTVVVTPGPIAAAASNVTINAGQNVTLTASGGGTYTWSNGMTDSPIVVAPQITTIYCVTVTDANNCSDTTCVTVYIEPLSCAGVSTEDAFVVPSAFSPNADGENDKWRLLYVPLLADCIAEFEVEVYNRWGENVFVGTDINFFWDGTYKGKLEETAVFGYYITGTLKDGKKITKKGNLSLLR